MNQLYNTYIPDGFATVNSYLFTEHPIELIKILENTFDAIEISRTIHPTNGDIANVILTIGKSNIMIAQARGKFTKMHSALYLYADDVDKLHQQAIENGAIEEFAPADMPYGDRQSGIQDPSGNYWWISKRLVEKGYD